MPTELKLKTPEWQRFEVGLRDLASRRSKMSRKKFRRLLLLLMGRAVESAKAGAAISGTAEAVEAAECMEKILDAMQRNDVADMERLAKFARSRGGFNFLTEK